MTDATRVPELELRREKARGADAACGLRTIDRDEIAKSTSAHDSEPRRQRPPKRPWPFSAADVSPLQWRRTLPCEAFLDAEQLLLRATLERIAVLHGGDGRAAAIAGDAPAAIGGALCLMPVADITLAVDIAMTALCRCALTPNATAALVMVQVIGLTDLDHGLAIKLAASWGRHGQRYATDPEKFRKAEALLHAAFRESRRGGEYA